ALVSPEVTGRKIAETASISTLPPLATPSTMLTPLTTPPEVTCGAPKPMLAVSPEVGTPPLLPLIQFPESNQLPLPVPDEPTQVSVSLVAISRFPFPMHAPTGRVLGRTGASSL